MQGVISFLKSAVGAALGTGNPTPVSPNDPLPVTASPGSPLVVGAVANAASPTLIEGSTDPLSLDLHGSQRALIQDASGAPIDWTLPVVVQPEPFPNGAVAICDSSGNVANSAATAVLAAVAGKTTYIKSVTFSAGGATVAAEVIATLTNLSNAGIAKTLSYIIGAPLGAGVVGQNTTIDFGNGFPAYAANTAITASMPALGAGNTNASVSITGYYK